MAQRERPLSPHLQIYRPEITSVLSILHRLTGVALSVGTLLLVWWLLATALGGGAFAVADGFLGSIIGQILLFGWTFALFYHLANGIRHLGWDLGYGFDLGVLKTTGWLVVAAALGLTVLAWAIAWATMA